MAVEHPTKTETVGDYEFERSEESLLGKGAFGSVWLGRKVINVREDNGNVREDEKVAVKEVEITDKTKKWVEREQTLMKKFHSENIIKLFCDIQIGSIMFFVLEYCILGTLNQFFKRQQNKTPFKQCLQYMGEIAKGVKYLHEFQPQPICHRDLKPSNILVQDAGHGRVCMKVADLGLARSLISSSSKVTLTQDVGSPGWEAPEISSSAESDQYSVQVDVFSLGLIFLSMLRHEQGKDLLPHRGICYVYI